MSTVQPQRGSDPPASPEQWRPQSNPWAIAVAVMLATFMEILDTTIVTVSLPHIAGNLSANVDEATWVVTSYLVSNAIILPASGWLGTVFGRKRFFVACIIIFTASSFLCGAAADLPMLLVARVLQGAGGGALQPLSQAILLESFPPAKRGLAMAAFGLGVVVAPIIGPTLGGWITDNYSWRWIFYINIPVGLLAVLLIHTYVEDPPYLRSARPGRIDAIGFGLMALGLATLQVVLDRGQQDDWLAAAWIRWFIVLSFLALVTFIIWELRTAEPIVNLRILGNRNFGAGTLLMALFGVVIYAPLTLLPLFLQTVMGYPALQSGFAMSPRGLGAFLAMPIIGRLTGRVDARLLMLGGFFGVAVAIFKFGNINLEISVANIAWPNILLGFSMASVFVPLTTLAMGTLRNEQMGNAAGIFNLVRNLGGSMGISAVTTMLVRGAQAHQGDMVSHLTPYDPAFDQRLNELQGLFAQETDPVTASQRAYGLLYGTLIQQATLSAYVDNFRLLGYLPLVCIPLVFLLKKVKPTAPLTMH